MERNEAFDRLYAAAFTSINAPNIKTQLNTPIDVPFQAQPRLPLGQPPVRYPDLTTIPGFLADPRGDASDLRTAAVRQAQAAGDGRPTAREVDSMVTMGRQAPPGYFKQDPNRVTPREMLLSTFNPNYRITEMPLTAWT